MALVTYCLLETSTGLCVDKFEWDDVYTYTPATGYSLAPNDDGEIEWTWNGTVWIPNTGTPQGSPTAPSNNVIRSIDALQGTVVTGDTLYADASNNFTRLGIGSTGDILTVSSGVPVLSAPAAAGGTTQLLESASVGTASTYNITNTTITQAYKLLLLVVNGISHTSGTNQAFQIRISGDNGTTLTTALGLTPTTSTSGNAFSGYIIITNSDATTGSRTIAGLLASSTSATGGASQSVSVTTGFINYIRLQTASGGNLDAGTVSLYGFE